MTGGVSHGGNGGGLTKCPVTYTLSNSPVRIFNMEFCVNIHFTHILRTKIMCASFLNMWWEMLSTEDFFLFFANTWMIEKYLSHKEHFDLSKHKSLLSSLYLLDTFKVSLSFSKVNLPWLCRVLKCATVSGNPKIREGNCIGSLLSDS